MQVLLYLRMNRVLKHLLNWFQKIVNRSSKLTSKALPGVTVAIEAQTNIGMYQENGPDQRQSTPFLWLITYWNVAQNEKQFTKQKGFYRIWIFNHHNRPLFVNKSLNYWVNGWAKWPSRSFAGASFNLDRDRATIK